MTAEQLQNTSSTLLGYGTCPRHALHMCMYIYIYIHIYIYTVSYIVVAMHSKDRYKIIGLRKISHFIKQPCRNVCLEKRYKCIKVAETVQYVG